ncbi:MAG: type II toxin-antitoxin system RelB/DinJ family antitoxin [Phascolarctobacterium sp.]|nr:type II toxin-antitoxin system RelB/DinJ family antitoxin [Phascolarctobacterium sp.]
MAKSATVFARVEPNVKEQAEAILNNLGLSMSNAVDIYLRQIVMRKGIPFDVSMDVKAPIAMGALSKEELDAEIAKGMEDIKAGRTYSAAEVRAEMERKYGL